MVIRKIQKIDSYMLRDNTINKMMELLKRSIRTKTEYGFKLCLDDKYKNINPGTPYKGKEGHLDSTESECKKNEKFIGTFHTHQYGKTPSIQDLHNGYLNMIGCIGYYDGITCFKRKKEHFDQSEYNEILLVENKEKFLISENDRYYNREKEEKYNKEIKRLVDSYFNVVDIKK